MVHFQAIKFSAGRALGAWSSRGSTVSALRVNGDRRRGSGRLTSGVWRLVVVVVRMKLWRWEVRKLTGLHLALNPHLTEGPKGEGRGETLGRSLASPKTMQQKCSQTRLRSRWIRRAVQGV